MKRNQLRWGLEEETRKFAREPKPGQTLGAVRIAKSLNKLCIQNPIQLAAETESGMYNND